MYVDNAIAIALGRSLLVAVINEKTEGKSTEVPVRPASGPISRLWGEPFLLHLVSSPYFWVCPVFLHTGTHPPGNQHENSRCGLNSFAKNSGLPVKYHAQLPISS
jgi:hypothetical protein